MIEDAPQFKASAKKYLLEKEWTYKCQEINLPN